MIDKRYELDRNALILAAEMHANKEAGLRPYGDPTGANEAWAENWNRVFHARMDELARGAGLVEEEPTP